MSLTDGSPPQIDPQTFRATPYLDRIKLLSRHWVEYGFGAPKITPIIYILKLLFFYAAGGILVATLTSGIDPFDPAAWWDAPIVYQKLVIWTVLLESLGVAGSWGPLAGHFKPFTAGFRHYARPRTIRLPPWPDKVPFTRGDERTGFDVALYLVLMAAIVAALLLPSEASSDLTALVGANDGLVATPVLTAIIVLLVALGLRDKVFFLAARSEQYLPALVFFAFFPFVDMIVAAKLLIVITWTGAAFSKFGRHFSSVIPPMVSNTPWLFVKAIKRAHYRQYPDDLRPSERAVGLAHVGGTLVEFVTPFVLLFSTNPTVTAIGVAVMICFHIFIISTFPLAVPLEWNMLFMYITAFLFLGFANYDGFGLGAMDPVLLVVTVAGLLFFPVLGNLRPDLVSFLPAMRQYAGNWASAMWAFAPGAERKLDRGIVKAAAMQKQQLTEMYDEGTAEIMIHQPLGWRAMHSQGRGLNSVMAGHLDVDIDHYDLREAEFCCNAILGFNFGDGHLHDQRLIEALQTRCQFEPGEMTVVWAESEAFGSGRQNYWVMDAAVGIVERGSWSVREAVAEQAWLPDGPIDTDVTYRREGYIRVSHPALPGDAANAAEPALAPG